MHTPSIGLLVLAKDEEAAIARCLTSVMDECDQMIVLDMESEDRTASIARSHGAQVLPVPQQPNFDGVRQLALDMLRTDWVLQLDADEWAPSVIPKVRDSGHLSRSRPLAFPKINYLSGRPVYSNRWWPNYQVRMFRRGSGHYVSHWHNYLEYSGRPLRLPKSRDFAIHHGGHSSVAEMLTGTARWAPERQDLSARSVALILGKSVGGFILTAGWREGSDGLNITAARMINETARQVGYRE